MLRTDINHNIDKYNEGTANGYSFRALCCFALAALVMVAGVVIIIKLDLPIIFVSWFAGIPAMGLVYAGINKKEGWVFEELLQDKLFRLKCFNVEFEAEEIEAIALNPCNSSTKGGRKHAVEEQGL